MATTQDVADYLGLILDAATQARLEPVVASANTWVARTRPDLDWTQPPPDDVHLGTVMAAAIAYQQASSPSGLPGYDDMGTYNDITSAWGSIYRLIGYRKPVAS